MWRFKLAFLCLFFSSSAFSGWNSLALGSNYDYAVSSCSTYYYNAGRSWRVTSSFSNYYCETYFVAFPGDGPCADNPPTSWNQETQQCESPPGPDDCVSPSTKYYDALGFRCLAPEDKPEGQYCPAGYYAGYTNGVLTCIQNLPIPPEGYPPIPDDFVPTIPGQENIPPPPVKPPDQVIEDPGTGDEIHQQQTIETESDPVSNTTTTTTTTTTTNTVNNTQQIITNTIVTDSTTGQEISNEIVSQGVIPGELEVDDNDNTAGGGRTCTSPPVCSGDAIQCLMLYQQWETRCAVQNLSDQQNGTLTGGDDCTSPPVKDDDITDFEFQTVMQNYRLRCPLTELLASDSNATFDTTASDNLETAKQEYRDFMTQIKNDISSTLSVSVSGSGSISDNIQTIKGASVNFSFSKWSSELSIIGTILVALCYISAAFMIFGASSRR